MQGIVVNLHTINIKSESENKIKSSLSERKPQRGNYHHALN